MFVDKYINGKFQDLYDTDLGTMGCNAEKLFPLAPDDAFRLVVNITEYLILKILKCCNLDKEFSEFSEHGNHDQLMAYVMFLQINDFSHTSDFMTLLTIIAKDEVSLNTIGYYDEEKISRELKAVKYLSFFLQEAEVLAWSNFPLRKDILPDAPLLRDNTPEKADELLSSGRRQFMMSMIDKFFQLPIEIRP